MTMDWEALGEEHRAWKWAPREPGGGKQEVHGQGPRSPGMLTSDWKGAALIRTVIGVLSSAKTFSK